MITTGFVLLWAGLGLAQSTPKPSALLSAEKTAKTASFVLGLHGADGGYASQKGASPSLRATLSARRSLKLLGEKAPNPEKDMLFVASCVDADGGFADRPGTPSSTALALSGLLVATDFGMHKMLQYTQLIETNKKLILNNAKTFEEVRMAAAVYEALGVPSPRRNEWVRIIRATHSDVGGYGPPNSRLRDTGGAVAALLRLKEPLAKREKEYLQEFLLSGQGREGGFGMTDTAHPDLDCSYRIGRALWMLGATPDAAKMRAFLESCRSPSGAYAPHPGEEPTLVDTYRALIISSWLKGGTR
jgi:prenyltransferase beta subunit